VSPLLVHRAQLVTSQPKHLGDQLRLQQLAPSVTAHLGLVQATAPTAEEILAAEHNFEALQEIVPQIREDHVVGQGAGDDGELNKRTGNFC
jgi:hypothetical protein